jgi:predicted GTPase
MRAFGAAMMERKEGEGPVRVIIMGAAGRDFHNFNLCFRDREKYKVVAFTAAQIPNIEGRCYPPELAGSLYPEGIPIYPESELISLIRSESVDLVVFSYSDVSYVNLMHHEAEVSSAGADFMMLGVAHTQLKARVPVVSVGAVRTGCGKSQTTRKICDILVRRDKTVVVVRHPMPYGDLVRQKVQRFASREDFDRFNCTIEEREEYEPHIEMGTIVYAGVDYGEILSQAQEEADILVWDGGNNDTPFFKPTVHIVLVDPHRPGHELRYYPGETNLRLADAVVINKVDTVDPRKLERMRDSIRRVNTTAMVICAASPVSVEDTSLISGKRVLVIEDGPTVTHGEMPYGAGVVAAQKFGARELVDARPFAVGSLRETFEKYPHLKKVLPAVGYSDEQVRELEATINATECDLVVSATPVDLSRLISIGNPLIRVQYEYQGVGHPTLEDALGPVLE